jgi:SRSO17 transposase
VRWQVERGYQQVKDKLGLDHFEERSWPGFHHATMPLLAYGILASELRVALAAFDQACTTEEAGRGA